LRLRHLYVIPLVLFMLSAGIAGWTAFHASGRTAAAPVRLGCVAGPCGTIRHIIIMDKENRTFDSMFGTFPGANGATTYRGTDGRIHSLLHQPDQLALDLAHDPQSAVRAVDGGRMDGFGRILGAIQHGLDFSDSQLYQTDIPNYWAYARSFTLDDRFFSSVLGPSFPNHLVTIAGSSGNTIDNPWGNSISAWGCDSGARTVDAAISPTTGRRYIVGACFNMTTIADVLDRRHISWKYYAPGQNQSGYIWSSFDAIKHIRFGPDWNTKVVNYMQFAADAAAGRLPSVSWLVEPEPVSDHPSASICVGENWTVQQIDAVMSNPAEWAHTAIVLTWDDFGGLYDHVVPPSAALGSRSQLGLRVPAVVISPYARRGYVDHTEYTFGSLLKLIEDTFGLPSLTAQDGLANGLSGSFDFRQKPLPPLRLQPRENCPGLPFTATVEQPRIAAGATETMRASNTPGMILWATISAPHLRPQVIWTKADMNGLALIRFRVPAAAAGQRITIVLNSPYRVHPAVRTIAVLPNR
jgi:phospholipase C